MATKMTEWDSKLEPIPKTKPSDGGKEDIVPLVVKRWYDFAEFRGYLGNVGWYVFKSDAFSCAALFSGRWEKEGVRP